MNKSTAEGSKFRPEIEQGWTRSALSGLDQGMEVRDPVITEINVHSRLRHAADPILNSLTNQLLDTRFSVLLADREARIVDRRVGGRAPAQTLERVKAIPGAQYVESVSGTNSLATAFETSRPVSVSGSEHFLEALRVFTCFGAPIIHPITGRVEGVLDITGPRDHENDLLKPFLLRAVSDIADRLRIGSRRSDQRLFAEFQARTARSSSAVIAYGHDLVLRNTAAQDLLSEQDLQMVERLAEESDSTALRTSDVVLASGAQMRALIETVEGTDRGVIVELQLGTRPGSPSTRRHRGLTESGHMSAPDTDTLKRILITGEPGTGKTTHARSIAASLVLANAPSRLADNNVGYLDCAKLFGEGSAFTASQLDGAISGSLALVIDDIHVLGSTEADVVRRAISEYAGHVILVSGVANEDDLAQRSLRALATQQQTLSALRDDRSAFDRIVRDALLVISNSNRLGSDHQASEAQNLRVVPSALGILRRQEWPGNRAELMAVLNAAARSRSVGDITVQDLPLTHRFAEPDHLSHLERVERTAIIEALVAADGNKSHAATRLGIGRTTLYKRLRHYRIDL